MTQRDSEQQRIALECLKLAEATAGHAGTKAVVRRAEAYLAFVTGVPAETIGPVEPATSSLHAGEVA